MSQNLVPLDGGQSKIVTSTAVQGAVYLSSQYTQANKIVPQPTEWTSGRRPIYGRLPAASQTYKLEFGMDEETAYVYVPTGNSSVGPGSLQVTKSDDNKFLLIQSGEIVWKQGNLPAVSVIIDLELLDMRSTKYLLAYQMYFDDSPFVAEYQVEDFSLSGYELSVSSNTDVVPGWRYNPVLAFTDGSEESWRNYDGLFPSYASPAELTWQAPYSHSYSIVRMRCPSNFVATGSATLHYMNCGTSLEAGTYCVSPTWVEQMTSSVSSDENGYYFEFEIPEPSYQRGWKVSWTDPKVFINRVEVSGVLSLEKKPSEATTAHQLIAYPENSVPSAITNLNGEQIPTVLCELANVDVNQFAEVEKIQDLRKIVGTSYTPVADWLTKPWDDNLMSMYDQVDNYSEVWMNPVVSMKQEYASLEKLSVTVED
jgi:hypothetical protein